MRNRLRSGVWSTLGSLPAFLTGAVCFAFALRLIVMICLLSNVSSHTINYNDFGWESWEMGWTARSIFLGQGFTSPFLPVTGPTALVPPLYPYILAFIFKIFGLNTIKVAFAVLGFNSLCSALTCVPLYFLARNSLNDRAGRIAAIAWSLYPFAIYFAADRVWDYAVTGLLFTSCLALAQTLPARRASGWAGFGALYGLAALSNPSVLSLLPVVLLFAMYRVWKASGPWLTRGLVASLAFVAVCTPWTVRNERVMHSHFLLRDGFWLEAYAGNNGDTRESNSAWAHPASNPIEMQKYEQEGEIGYMTEKRRMTLDFVKTHPAFFVEATARRILRFWTGYWSFHRDYLKYEPFDLPNVPFCLFLLIFMVRGLKRWWKENPAGTLPFLLALLVFPIPYYLTHSSMDYRQPIEPMILMLVTVGLFGTRAASQEREEGPMPLEEMEPEAEAVLV